MMTMHAAKGLEFPVVFVVGAEEGIFPGIRQSLVMCAEAALSIRRLVPTLSNAISTTLPLCGGNPPGAPGTLGQDLPVRPDGGLGRNAQPHVPFPNALWLTMSPLASWGAAAFRKVAPPRTGFGVFSASARPPVSWPPQMQRGGL